MPSAESDYIGVQFRQLGERFAANPNFDLRTRRDILDNLHWATIEPTGVTYEEVRETGICHSLWHKPLESAADRVILYAHGGGFLSSNTATHRKLVGHLAKWAGIAALSIDYRLAPEHAFPAQIEDCLQAYRWLLKKGFEPGNIALAGDSAGGSIVVGTVLKLRDLGESLPGAIYCSSPMLDMEMKGTTMKSNAATDVMSSEESFEPLVQAYLGPNGNRQDPLANPLYADLTGLPPIYVSVGTFERLQDDGERLVIRAREHGVDTTIERGEKLQHNYVIMAGRAREADETLQRVGAWLKEKLRA